jgi:2-amino-4-hydroxy-6-hydroxymethyldihydropteridine diphosphokinase
MNKAYLLLGGNLGERGKNLETARAAIGEHCGTILRSSAVYETAAWGLSDQPPFLNQAIELETEFTAVQLIGKILKIEKDMGRERLEKNGPRNIDIDILLFNEEKIHYPFLVVPHPELQNRRFALAPMEEIAPELHHPIFKKTIQQLLAECRDVSDVKKFKV